MSLNQLEHSKQPKQHIKETYNILQLTSENESPLLTNEFKLKVCDYLEIKISFRLILNSKSLCKQLRFTSSQSTSTRNLKMVGS